MFRVSDGDVKIGVIQFSEEVTVEVPLGSISNDVELTNAINSITYQAGTRTNTHFALTESVNELTKNGRKGVPKQIILLTDGEPIRPELAKDEAEKARKDNITITVIGINVPDTDIIRSNLEAISSSMKITTVENVQELNRIVDDIVNKTCPGMQITEMIIIMYVVCTL